MKNLAFYSALLAVLSLTLAAPAFGNSPSEITEAIDRIETLRKELETLDRANEPNLDVLLEERDAAARALQAEIASIERELELQLTGVEDGAFEAVFEPPPTDLQAELFKFVEPFLLTLRSVTAESREIEEIRRELSGLEEQRVMSAGALERLHAVSVAPEGDASDARAAEILDRSSDLQTRWSDRLTTSEARIANLQSRLDALLAGGADDEASTAPPATFLRDRVVTLTLGLLASVATWLVFSLVGSLLGVTRRGLPTQRAPSKHHTLRSLGVPQRAFRLIYRGLTITFALIAALAVFNARNDWLLLGLGVILLLGFVWTVIKSLPDSIEQVRLLLNLGSVQEGERLMFDGIPWRVSILDFHSVLENPLLESGDLALPVGDLSGHYSRPVAPEEGWFPTEAGDWVLLDDDKVAQVEIQTPGTVTLRRLGGGTIVIPSPAFVEEPPMNLTNGFRVELEFGIDYSHQADATTTIVDTMRSCLEERLPAYLPAGSIKNLEVEFFAASESSLNYEIEVDLDGSAASEYEEVGRILSRLLVDCCNENGWKIPFRQIQVHGVG